MTIALSRAVNTTICVCASTASLGNAENMSVKIFKTRELDQGSIPNRFFEMIIHDTPKCGYTCPLNIVLLGIHYLCTIHFVFIFVIIDMKTKDIIIRFGSFVSSAEKQK